jgi:hypothetical protein
MVRVWYGNTCLAQQDLLSATDVAEEKLPEWEPEAKQDDESTDWNGILWIALIAAAVIFVLVAVLRIRAAAARRRHLALRPKPAAVPPSSPLFLVPPRPLLLSCTVFVLDILTREKEI